jgi:hypothetical protein
MPKISGRKQTIKHLSKVFYCRMLESFQLDDNSSDEDSLGLKMIEHDFLSGGYLSYGS